MWDGDTKAHKLPFNAPNGYSFNKAIIDNVNDDDYDDDEGNNDDYDDGGDCLWC